MKTFRIGIVALALVACGQAAEPQASTTTSSTPTSEPSVPAEVGEVTAAIADLAMRLDIDTTSITVVETREVQWPDGSLGCPQEGELYTQAVVDGTQIFLSAGDRIYDYRADSSGSVKLCPSDEKDGGFEFVPPPGADES